MPLLQLLLPQRCLAHSTPYSPVATKHLNPTLTLGNDPEIPDNLGQNTLLSKQDFSRRQQGLIETIVETVPLVLSNNPFSSVQWQQGLTLTLHASSWSNSYNFPTLTLTLLTLTLKLASKPP